MTDGTWNADTKEGMVMVYLDDDAISQANTDEVAVKLQKDGKLVLDGHEAWYVDGDEECNTYIETIV
jgi:hypothetical protein